MKLEDIKQLEDIRLLELEAEAWDKAAAAWKRLYDLSPPGYPRANGINGCVARALEKAADIRARIANDLSRLTGQLIKERRPSGNDIHPSLGV
jgi:hypothetical protein